MFSDKVHGTGINFGRVPGVTVPQGDSPMSDSHGNFASPSHALHTNQKRTDRTDSQHRGATGTVLK
jgi:hypothetical protein